MLFISLVFLFKYFGFYFNDLPTDHSTLATIDAFKQSQPPVDLESADLPMIVRFRDPAKLETVDLVDPEHLELSFGAGVTIVGVRAEITDEAATAGITKRLPWLLELRESFGKRLSIPYHNPMSRISVMSFKREF